MAPNGMGIWRRRSESLPVSEMSDVNSPISNDGATVAPRRPMWKRWVIRSILFLVAAGVAFGLWCVYEAASEALHAEKGLHATRLTIEAIGDYLNKHHGAWPRSWDQLEQSSSQMQEVYRSTGGREHVDEFVSVDFGADPDVLAKQTEEEFKAIEPVGPSFDNYRSHVPFLLDTLKQTRQSKKGHAKEREAAVK